MLKIKMSTKNKSTFSQLLKKLYDRFDIKNAIKMGVTAALAWTSALEFGYLINRPDVFASGLWTTMAAIVVMQSNLGSTYKTAWNRFLGIIIGSILGGFCVIWFGSNPISLGVSVGLTLLFCNLINIKESIRIACLSVTVVLVLWGLNPNLSPWTFTFFRIIDSLLGIIIAMIVSHTLWKVHASEKLQANSAKILTDLNTLCRLIFQKIPKGHSLNDWFINTTEIESLFLQNDVALEESSLEVLSSNEGALDWKQIAFHLKAMYTAIFQIKNCFSYPIKMMDQELSDQVFEVENALDHVLQSLSSTLITNEMRVHIEDLEHVEQRLEQQLERFRSTKATRKFNLNDIENFFVFFHNLNILMTEIKKIHTIFDNHFS